MHTLFSRKSFARRARTIISQLQKGQRPSHWSIVSSMWMHSSCWASSRSSSRAGLARRLRTSDLINGVNLVMKPPPWLQPLHFRGIASGDWAQSYGGQSHCHMTGLPQHPRHALGSHSDSPRVETNREEGSWFGSHHASAFQLRDSQRFSGSQGCCQGKGRPGEKRPRGWQTGVSAHAHRRWTDQPSLCLRTHSPSCLTPDRPCRKNT